MVGGGVGDDAQLGFTAGICCIGFIASTSTLLPCSCAIIVLQAAGSAARRSCLSVGVFLPFRAFPEPEGTSGTRKRLSISPVRRAQTPRKPRYCRDLSWIPRTGHRVCHYLPVSVRSGPPVVAAGAVMRISFGKHCSCRCGGATAYRRRLSRTEHAGTGTGSMPAHVRRAGPLGCWVF